MNEVLHCENSFSTARSLSLTQGAKLAKKKPQ
jgi:hypothetical protein